MNHIERVVVDEGVGPDSKLMAQFRDRLGSGERQVVFVFLASEHPGIPDIEVLDELLDGRSVLLTQDRVLHNLAIGRGFRSMIKTSELGLTDRRLADVAALDRHLPVVRGTLRDSYAHQAGPETQAIAGCVSGFLSAQQLTQLPETVPHQAAQNPRPFRFFRQHSDRGTHHWATAHHAGDYRRLHAESGCAPWRQESVPR
jgi:hypothetical protein